jgi:GntR family transcriptional regulator
MLPFSVSLRAGFPIHDQLVLAVRRAVVSGQLRPGEPFPSVRSLSQELGINPNTAHKVVATLVSDGILAVKPGVGTVIADHPYDTRSERRQVLQDDVQRLVVESRRAGLTLADLLASVRRHWAKIVRRAG